MFQLQDIAGVVDRFTEVRPGLLYNFRCPICGDSHHNKYKKRGYLINERGEWRYFCHNCSWAGSLSSFLYTVSKPLYYEYKKSALFRRRILGEDFSNSQSIEETKNKERVKKMTRAFSVYMKPVSETRDPEALSYMKSERGMPDLVLSEVYWVKQFKEFLGLFFPEKLYKFSDVPEHPRLVLPFFHKKQVLGFTARSADPKSKMRFVNLSATEDITIWGEHRLSPETETIFVFEGALDAMLVNGGISVQGISAMKRFAKNGRVLHKSARVVYVPDNDWQYNPDVFNVVSFLAKSGHSIGFFRSEYSRFKDVSDVVKFFPEKWESDIKTGRFLEIKRGIGAEFFLKLSSYTGVNCCESKKDSQLPGLIFLRARSYLHKR